MSNVGVVLEWWSLFWKIWIIVSQKKLKLKEQVRLINWKMAEPLENKPVWMSLHPVWNVETSTRLWVTIMLNANDWVSFSLLLFLRGKQCASQLKKLERNREKQFGILRFQGKGTCTEPCCFSHQLIFSGDVGQKRRREKISLFLFPLVQW